MLHRNRTGHPASASQTWSQAEIKHCTAIVRTVMKAPKENDSGNFRI